ncbi:MAG: alginate lyase family protein [Terracidiphilus sp.]
MFQHLLQCSGSPVRHRSLPYYRPSAELTRESAFARPILAFADLICAGHFLFLSYETQGLGTTPNWNRDFISGGEWPKGVSRPTALLKGSDPKSPWELSRLQFLPILGKAYWITGTKSYCQRGEELLADWVEKNPVGKTINWSNAMEPALRAVSICQFLNLTLTENEQPSKWITRALWEHLIFIETHLEFSYRFRGNHYLSNLLGLFCLSVSLDGDGMKARREQYRAALEEEMWNQVYPDGGDYEASSGYHVFVTQIFTAALLFARAAQIQFSETFVERLSSMYEYANALGYESGRAPHIGDCDDGRVELTADDIEQMLALPVSERHSLLLSSHLGVGRWVCGKPLDTRVDDALWFGASADNAVGRIAPERLRVFTAAGVAVAHNPDCSVILLAQPNGLRGKGSHTHNDTREIDLRNRLRSTAAHNTFMVDGMEQNRFQSSPEWTFCMGDEAGVTPLESFESQQSIALEAAHFGYRAQGVTHKRRVILEAEQLRIEDELKSKGEHTYSAYFHLAPNWQVINMQQESDNSVALFLQGPSNVSFRLSACSAIKVSVEVTPISRAFGTTIASQCLVMTTRHVGNFQSAACLRWKE